MERELERYIGLETISGVWTLRLIDHRIASFLPMASDRPSCEWYQ